MCSEDWPEEEEEEEEETEEKEERFKIMEQFWASKNEGWPYPD